MHSDVDRATYKFIADYAAENGGKAPSWALVTASVEGYEHWPEIGDNYEYLTRMLKAESATQAVINMFQSGEVQRKLNEMPGDKFLGEYLLPALESVKLRTNVRETTGTDIKRDSGKFLAEYDRRKAGESFRIWKSKFSAIGEYVSGNLYTVFGKSGRGKSVIALEDAIYAASQGANVLIWAMEMGWYEVLVRIYVSISGESGITAGDFSAEVDNGLQIPDTNMDVGFDSRDVRLGQLNEAFEDALRQFLETLNEHIPGNLTVRAVDDEDFGDRTLRALEADIGMTDADYVVIDPFYYMDYEANTSKTTGGDAANTSTKLRRLTGRKSVVTIAITQADETSESEDIVGERELELPARKDVKKTKALLEDAALLIGVDSAYKQGRALVGVFKGRDGGEGNTSELLYMPQFGVVKEMETGEAAAGDFVF